MRANRLVSLLLLLQGRGRMTAEALASELEVSVRTVYWDVAGLSDAGVPVYGERGEGGGFQLIDGYRTNLTGLTAGEAETLLLTGAAGPLTELGLGSILATTRLKLLAAVPPGLREVATRAEQRFHLDPAGWAHAAPRDQRHLQTVAGVVTPIGAVWRDRQLRISYERGDQRRVRRLLDPLGLVHKTGTWYLVAAEQGRPRVYRVDRIRAADEVDAAARRPDEFDLAGFWSAWEGEYAATLPTFAVRVRLGPIAHQHIGRLGALAPRAVSDVAIGDDGWVQQTLVFDDRRMALAAMQAFAPDVEVLEPADLRADLIANLKQMIARGGAVGARGSVA